MFFFSTRTIRKRCSLFRGRITGNTSQFYQFTSSHFNSLSYLPLHLHTPHSHSYISTHYTVIPYPISLHTTQSFLYLHTSSLHRSYNNPCHGHLQHSYNSHLQHQICFLFPSDDVISYSESMIMIYFQNLKY